MSKITLDIHNNTLQPYIGSLQKETERNNMEIVCFKIKPTLLQKLQMLSNKKLYFNQSETTRIACLEYIFFLQSQNNRLPLSKAIILKETVKLWPSVSIKFPKALLEVIDSISQINSVSRSNFIIKALRYYLATKNIIHDYFDRKEHRQINKITKRRQMIGLKMPFIQIEQLQMLLNTNFAWSKSELIKQAIISYSCFILETESQQLSLELQINSSYMQWCKQKDVEKGNMPIKMPMHLLVSVDTIILKHILIFENRTNFIRLAVDHFLSQIQVLEVNKQNGSIF